MINLGTTASDILSQEEIDALLHPSSGGTKQNANSDLIKTALPSMASPLLQQYVDSLCRHLTTTLRQTIKTDNISVTLQSLISGQLGTYLDQLPFPTLLGFMKSEKWKADILCSMHSNLAYSLLDILLGGKRGTATLSLSGRSYTRIEQTIIRNFLDKISSALKDTFNVDFNLTSTDTNPKTAMIAPPACEMMIIRLSLILDGRGGELDVVIPSYLLEEIQPTSEAVEKKQTFFQQQMEKAISGVSVELNAVLDERTISLRDVLKWRVGQKLPFRYTEGQQIRLECNGVCPFKGRLENKGKLLYFAVTPSILTEDK